MFAVFWVNLHPVLANWYVLQSPEIRTVTLFAYKSTKTKNVLMLLWWEGELLVWIAWWFINARICLLRTANLMKLTEVRSFLFTGCESAMWIVLHVGLGLDKTWARCDWVWLLNFELAFCFILYIGGVNFVVGCGNMWPFVSRQSLLEGLLRVWQFQSHARLLCSPPVCHLHKINSAVYSAMAATVSAVAHEVS